MRRILSWMIMFCLLLTSLPAFAEGAASGGWTEAADGSVLNIEVIYDEENAEWDGKLKAQVRVSWNSPDGMSSAKNVRIRLEAKDGLVLPEDKQLLQISEMVSGGYTNTEIELQYDPSYETPDHVPEPKLIVTAWADGIGYTRYTARLDGTTIPRALVLGWETSDVGPQAVQTDVNLMANTFSKSYYNKRAFEVTSGYNEISFESSLSRIEGWEEDKNDVTYVYINAHGAMDSNVPIPGFFANTIRRSIVINGKEYTGGGLVSFEDLLSYLDRKVKGRVVLITEVCYSGQLMSVANSMGIDVDKFSILTAAQASRPSILWPDRFDLNDLDASGFLLGWADLPEVNTLFSYGWFTNDLCDLLDAGYAKDENGVVTIGEAYRFLHDAAYALKSRIDTALNDANEEKLDPSAFSGLDDLFDAIDASGERVKRMFNFRLLALMDEMDPLEALKQSFMLSMDLVNPAFGGRLKTLLYCSDPEYDNGERLLTVIEEKVEYASALELYYDYLDEWVVPEIGLARRDERFTGRRCMDWDAEYWEELHYIYGFSGLLSAAVCDLDKNGSLDMITLSIKPREKALIEATNVYFTVDLEMYQIENGEVVPSDMREDVLLICEENNGIWSRMECWMLEYNNQVIFRSNCYSTPGMSGVGDWSHSFSCTFKDGRIIDGAPSTYQAGYELKTEDGLSYGTPDYDDDIFEHAGDGVAAIEACYSTMEGGQYNATDATNLYDYLYGYQPIRVYKPLKLISVPIQPSRKDEVKAGIDQAVNAAMSAVGKTAYGYGVSCNRDTGEATQMIIYSDQDDYDSVDTEKLREIALAMLKCPEVAASAEAVSVMEGFEFKKKSEIRQESADCEIVFMMIPDGTYALVLNFYDRW